MGKVAFERCVNSHLQAEACMQNNFVLIFRTVITCLSIVGPQGLLPRIGLEAWEGGGGNVF